MKLSRELSKRETGSTLYILDEPTTGLHFHEEFEGTLLERDMPQLGISIPAAALGRFWLMLTHYHARVWKGSELARLFVIHPGKDSSEMNDQT